MKKRDTNVVYEYVYVTSKGCAVIQCVKFRDNLGQDC